MKAPERRTFDVHSLPLHGLFERVRATVPLVASRAGAAEIARRPDDDVIEALKATGVFRAFVPERFERAHGVRRRSRG